MKTLLAALLASVAVLAGCHNSGRVQNTTDFRAVNAIIDAEPLDVLINGDVKLGAVAFATTTNYITFDAGNVDVKLRSTTNQSVLFDGTYGLGNAIRNTLIAYGRRDAAAVLLMPEDTVKPSAGHARVRVAQLAPDAGAVDVYISGSTTPIGTPVLSGTTYPVLAGPVEVPAGKSSIVVTVAGSADVLFSSPAPLTFQDGGAYTVIVMPSRGGKLVNALFLEQGSGGGTYLASNAARIKAVNGIPGSMLNVKLDGTAVLSAVTFTGVSSYINTSSGTHTVTLEQTSVPGSALASASLTLEGARDYSLLAGGTLSAPRLVTLTDDNSAPASGFAKVRYVNALADGATVDVLFNSASQAAGLVPYVPSSYFLTPPGTNLTIAFTTPGGVTTIAATTASEIDAGGVYTAYLFGTTAAPQALLVRDR